MKRYISILFTLLILINFLSCFNKDKYTVLFSYLSILDKEYRFNVGKVIPLTIEQSIELDGDISSDGLYFYYSSNRDMGNYDIYLRNLSDITTVRVTNHPSKDISPAISPDGESLVFVSNREDPEGDIYVVDLDPEDLIAEKRRSIFKMPSLDEEAVNITQFQDSETKTIKIIKDSSPAWSPDGKRIVFSSKRDGSENIWMVNRNGKDLKQITSKGGVYPQFSPDGSGIIFISYRDGGSKGDVYTLNLDTDKERRITETGAIELYPSFCSTNNEIIYSVIDRDTNGDGEIDLNDNPVIYYRDLSGNMVYPLTLYSKSSFAAKWLPVFGTKYYKGVIVYSDQIGENININVIPDTGIIPKRGNAQLQYDLANSYLLEFNDTERHLLALERVHHFFGRKRDNDSQIYVSRALVKAAIEYKENRQRVNSQRMLELLAEASKKGNAYVAVLYEYLKSVLSGKRGNLIIQQALQKAVADGNMAYYIPYFMEDLADEYMLSNRAGEASRIYRKIISDYERYKRLVSVHDKLSRIIDASLRVELSPSVLNVLKSGKVHEKIEMKKHLLNVFIKEKNRKKRISILEKMLNKYSENKDIVALLLYSIGKTHLEMGNAATARNYLHKTLKNSVKTDIIFYKSNILLGEIAFREKKLKETEAYYSAAANMYKLVFRESNFRNRVNWLIDYYEEYGERAELSGNYKEAILLYERYTRLLGYLHRRKGFRDIYNKYGPRSHVLYIDAYSELKGERNIDDLLEAYLKDLPKARMDFDKAYIYGLGYIYTKKALLLEQEKVYSLPEGNTGLEDILINFKNAIAQLEWAIFFDDTFIDPFILKSWIYQYLDLKRQEKDEYENEISEYFPKHLWEKNISILSKALIANNEGIYKENEGNIHLNMANNYFLLLNYPRALYHYKMAHNYKKRFDSKIVEALFYFHMGYCYWQNGEIDLAREEITSSLNIYRSIASGKNIKRYKNQIYLLYKYFALFSRVEQKYKEAIGWYQKILTFTSKNSIPVDSARYLQEIAHCYRALGKVDRAISYLDSAHRLLKKSPDDEKKFYVKLYILGFGPFSIWNLGPDGAVIGDNKIFSGLDTRSKRLLNISMQEGISLESGNIQKAIKYLEKKVKILEERDYEVDKQGKFAALNNLGYYYFTARQYDKAINYFVKAWKYSSDPDVKNLSGSFAAIRNITSFYAFLFENNPEMVKEPVNQINGLLTEIADYREKYEEERFNIENEQLEHDAEARKKKLSEEELDDLKKRIAEEAMDIYYNIDIAVGVLKFYKAELLLSREKEIDISDDAFNIYKRNELIFSLYADALKRFEYALETAEKREEKRLIVKLKLNIGSCYTEIGAINKAYASYLDAKEIVEINRLYDLQLSLYYKLGNFLRVHGKEVEGPDYLLATADYYSKALEMVEDLPLLYSGELKKIQDMYDSYTGILIKSGEWEKALFVSEKKYDTVKLILISLSSPEYYKEKDRHDYKEYLSRIRTISEIRRNISRMLDNGESADSESVKALDAELLRSNKNLRNYIDTMRKRRTLLATNLTVSKPVVPQYDNIMIYKFFKSGGNLYVWSIEAGEIKFKKLSGNKSDSFNLIAKYMNDTKDLKAAENVKSRYIVLNKSFLKLMKGFNYTGTDSMPPFMFTPSISRVMYYVNPDNNIINNVYYSGEGIKDILEESPFIIEEGGIEKTDYTGYSVIIDGLDNRIIEPAFLYKNRLQPALIIKNLDMIDMDYITMFVESSLYTGIKTVIFTFQADEKLIAEALSISEELGFSHAQPGVKIRDSVIGIGYSGISRETRKKSLASDGKREFMLYKKSIDSGDYDKARIHLNRWNSLQGGEEKTADEAHFLFESANIEILKGNYLQAFDYINRSLEQFGPDSESYERALIQKIFLLLYTGNINETVEIIENNSLRLKKYSDYNTLNAIIKLLSEGIDESIKFYRSTASLSANNDSDLVSGNKPQSKRTELKSILHSNRLRLLYAEYLSLFRATDHVKEIMKEWESDYPLSDREVLKSFYINEMTVERAGESERIKNIIGLSKITSDTEKLKNSTLLLLSKGEQYDAISLFPVLISIKYFIKNNILNEAMPFLANINIEDIDNNSLLLDNLLLLFELVKIYSLEGRYEKALETSNMIIKVIENRNMPSLFKRALYDKGIILAKLGRFRESYDTARKGEEFVKKEGRFYAKYQIHLMDCETSLGKYGDALKRGAILSEQKDLGKEYRYVLLLLKSRIELNRLFSMKKPTVEDGKKFNGMFMEAFNILDESPGVVKKFNRIDLIKEILDAYISYKANTGFHMDALIFAEVKKHIIARTSFTGLISSPFPNEILKEFNKIDARNSEKIIPLLNRFPELQLRKSFRVLPVQHLQKKLPADALLIYTIRNGNDVLIWMLGQRFKKFIKIKNGYLQLEEIVTEYRLLVSKFKNSLSISKELGRVFSPIRKYYSGKRLLIFVTDRSMEAVPFEIMGDKEMLEETCTIVYLSSIISGLKKFKSSDRIINVIGNSSDDNNYYLEKIAIKESGMRFSISDRIDSGIGHIHLPISYNKIDGRLYLGNGLYLNHIKNPQYIYLPSVNFYGIGYNDFSIFNSLKGVSGIIINDAHVHDLNNAIFVDTLYRELRRGENLLSAFDKAKYSIRNKKEFRHPAYWAGIRLYLNGI